MSGIQLDWDMDSGEDQQSPESTGGGPSRWWIWLAVGLGLIVFVIGGILLRSRQVDEQTRTALDAVVYAETLALRTADQEAFMNQQLDERDWRRFQRSYYEAYHADEERMVYSSFSLASPGFKLTDRVLDTTIDGERAYVTVGMEGPEGKLYQMTWLYVFEDGRWWHAPPNPDLMGAPQQISTNSFDINYYPVSQQLATDLAASIDEWWRITCETLTCPDERLSVIIAPEYNLSRSQETYDDEYDLVITPGIPLSVLPQDGDALMSYLEMTIQEMVRYLLADSEPFYSSMQIELARWLAQRIEPEVDTYSIFEAMVALYGPDFMTEAVGILEEDGTEADIISLVAAQSAVMYAPDKLPTNAALTAIIQTDVYLRLDGRERLADRFFSPTGINNLQTTGLVGMANQGVPQPFDTEAADVDAYRVVATEQVGPLLWVQVDSNHPIYGWVVVSFKYEEGRWLMAPYREGNYGETRLTVEGDYVSLSYYEMDQSLIPPTLMQDIDMATEQAADLLGVPVNRSFSVGVYPRQPNERNEDIIVRSAYTRFSENSVYDTVMYDIIWDLLSVELASVPSDEVDYLAFGILEVVKDEVSTSESSPYWQQIQVTGIDQTPTTLDELWGTRNYPESLTYQFGAELLVDMLVERYGPDAISDMVEALKTASSTTDWLEQSVGVTDIEALESEWLNAYQQALDASQ